jgi:CubicO group peptidase (beta-lactamase class C family)
MLERKSSMFRRSSRFVSLFLFLLFVSVTAPAQGDLDAKLNEIDEYALKARQDWNVPGFAMAIVKDNKVVFAKGYGVRELGKQIPVDEKTLFAIASNSKAFTAAAIGILLDCCVLSDRTHSSNSNRLLFSK